MKELSIEEKAKAYDELKVKAQELTEDGYIDNLALVDMFPELKESEGDKLKRIIKNALDSYFEGKLAEGDNDVDYAMCLAWLEKQGEQKSTDKVELKFKVGDWLQYRDAEPFLVKGITPKGYVNGNALLPFEWENEAHIWTIQDAKDGDVLINDFHLIFIFKEIKNNMYVSHCSVIDRENDTILNSIAEREVGNVNLVKCLPASKKQRDKLEEVIQREGYEWDAEKKDLKKIEQKPVDKVEPKLAWSEENYDVMINKLLAVVNLYYDRSGNDLDKQSCISFLKSLKDGVQPQSQSDERNRLLGKLEEWLDEYVSDLADVDTATLICSFTNYLDGKLSKSLRPRNTLKPAEWSEEDEDILNTIINHFKIDIECTDEDDIVRWLKSLKDRVQPQPKQELSEEDIEMIDYVASILYSNFNENDKFDDNKPCVGALVDRLKSLRPKSQWKPSGEQIMAIDTAINVLGKGTLNGKQLIELYQDLKKLKGEEI